MDAKSLAEYAGRAKIIKAMAHPTRLFLVDELSQNGERRVCELTEMVGVGMPTVSRHLAILKGVGIVEDERRGVQVYYRLRARCVLNFFECAESVMQCSAKVQRRMLAS